MTDLAPRDYDVSLFDAQVTSGAVCRHHSCAAITVSPNAAGWGFGLCPRHLVDREAVR